MNSKQFKQFIILISELQVLETSQLLKTWWPLCYLKTSQDSTDWDVMMTGYYCPRHLPVNHTRHDVTCIPKNETHLNCLRHDDSQITSNQHISVEMWCYLGHQYSRSESPSSWLVDKSLSSVTELSPLSPLYRFSGGRILNPENLLAIWCSKSSTSKLTIESLGRPSRTTRAWSTVRFKTRFMYSS